MSNIVLYSVTLLLLVISYRKDRAKTQRSIKKAWKSFENILPELLGIILLISILLALLNVETVSRVIGSSSGWLGVAISAIVGSIVLIPGFVAFPMVDMLMKNGAGVMQAAAFISTLMMVGVVTVPIEIKYFGKRLTLARNLAAFLFSFLVALVIGWVVTA